MFPVKEAKMMQTLDAWVLTLQLAFSVGLFICCFLRLALTDKETFVDVRAALVFKGSSAATIFFAPFAPIVEPRHFHWEAYTTPNFIWFLCLAASFFMQWVTSRHWEHGVPRSFLKPEHRQMTRKADFL